MKYCPAVFSAVLFLILTACGSKGTADLPAVRREDFAAVLWPAVEKAYAGVKANPADARANGNLAMVLHAGGKYDLGEVFYRRAIDRDASLRWIYYLSQLQTLKGARQDAIASLQQALKLDGRYVPVRLKLGRLLLEAGSAGEAQKVLEPALALAPDSAVAEFEMGRVMKALGRQRESLLHFERACAKLPAYGAAQYALAMAYRDIGRMDDAKIHFKLYEEYKDRLPTMADPLESEFLAAVQSVKQDKDLGRLALQRGDLRGAAAKLEAVVAKEPDNVAVRSSLIDIYYKLGDFPKAEAQYREAVRRNSNFYEAHYHYGMALIAQQRNSEAEAAFRQALQIQPAHAASLTQFGLLREKAGDNRIAIESYRKALDSEPSQRQASYLLGRQLVKQRRFDEGIAYLQDAAKDEDEQTPWFMRALAGAQIAAGRRELGLDLLRQAKEKAAAQKSEHLVQLLSKELAALSRTKASK